jgi:hypothetical protein
VSHSRDIRKDSIKRWIKNKIPIIIENIEYKYVKVNNRWKLKLVD